MSPVTEQEVPLVIYVEGERKVVGTAVVQDDGTVVMTMINPDSALIVGAFTKAEDHYSLARDIEPNKFEVLQRRADDFPKMGPWSLTVPLIPLDMTESVRNQKDNLDRDGD